MSYNPYTPGPPQQGYPPQQQHPLPPNPAQLYNQYPSSSNNYDRPPTQPMNPPAASTGYGQGQGVAAGYGNPSLPLPPPQYGDRRDDRGPPGPPGPPGGRYSGGRELSPGRRNNYPPRDDRPDRRDGDRGGRGFSRDRDRDRDRQGSGAPSGSGYGGGGGGGSGQRPRRDNRAIAERIELERQCRTLFVRNISFEAEPERLKIDFERHGEVKSWFDMISRRGMVFVTFFDLRAAQRAKEALHGIRVGSRDIDVHYGLPKEEDLKSKCDRDKNQGSILMILKPHVNINMAEAGRMCDSFGEVKSLRACNSASQAICEYWDSRGAIDLFDNMNQKPFEGGTWDIKYIWDEPPVGHAKESAQNSRREGSSGRGRRVSEQSSRGGGGYERDREPYPAQSRDRYSDHPPAPPVDDRLDQARKVQQLLANLGTVAPPPPAPQANNYPPYSSDPRAPGYAHSPPLSQYPPPPAAVRPPAPYSNPPPRGPPPPVSGYNAPPASAPGYSAPPPNGGYNAPPPGPPPPIYSGAGYSAPSPNSAYAQSPPTNPPYSNPNPAYNQPNPSNGYQAVPQPGYNPSPTSTHGAPYGQPPPSPYDPSAPAPPQGYNPNQNQNQNQNQSQGGYRPGPVPVAADPRRPPQSGYRPPPPQHGQGQGQGNSEVGNLLAMLNQER